MREKLALMIEESGAIREIAVRVKALERWSVEDDDARRRVRGTLRGHERRKFAASWLQHAICESCALVGPSVADPIIRELLDAQAEGARLYELRQAVKREGRKPALRAGSRVVAPEAKTA
jgi:hypothetical protein